jgi:CheY-like chemotaxis protein
VSWQQKPLVLIVDDDADFVSDLAVMLSSEFKILSASDTREACERWLEVRPDCILLDLNMPEYFSDDAAREGLAFLSHMRSAHEERMSVPTPVIVVSGCIDDRTIGEARAMGANGFFRKPLNINHLKASIWSEVASREGRAPS